MANRPIFLPSPGAYGLVRETALEFQWFAGLSVAQKQRSIDALHESGKRSLGLKNILEISSKSRTPLGVSLSAFNLQLELASRRVSVEVAFQAGKVFESGGPYLDLLNGSSREAKQDPRLKNSGALVRFEHCGQVWPLEPRTAFYDWLYTKALLENPDLSEQLTAYDAFTDIEFNPKKSLNCQARSAALFVALKSARLLDEATSTQQMFLEVTSKRLP